MNKKLRANIFHIMCETPYVRPKCVYLDFNGIRCVIAGTSVIHTLCAEYIWTYNYMAICIFKLSHLLQFVKHFLNALKILEKLCYVFFARKTHVLNDRFLFKVSLTNAFIVLDLVFEHDNHLNAVCTYMVTYILHLT